MAYHGRMDDVAGKVAEKAALAPLEENLNRIEIILCDTQDGANIGSVCRAMKTMGLTHLTLVTDRIYDEERVRTLALHAYDIYENRKEFFSLHDALADSVLSVAATRRMGKGRKTSRVNPQQLANRINAMGVGKVSIVFGCESNGLSDEQVGECSMVVTIPTSDAFPSLNLSQAVQIVAYSLFCTLSPYAGNSNVVDAKRTSQAAETCAAALDGIGYFKNDDEKAFTKEFLRDMFARAAMTEGEVQRMEKIFTKAGNMAKHGKRTQCGQCTERTECTNFTEHTPRTERTHCAQYAQYAQRNDKAKNTKAGHTAEEKQ